MLLGMMLMAPTTPSHKVIIIRKEATTTIRMSTDPLARSTITTRTQRQSEVAQEAMEFMTRTRTKIFIIRLPSSRIILVRRLIPSINTEDNSTIRTHLQAINNSDIPTHLHIRESISLEAISNSLMEATLNIILLKRNFVNTINLILSKINRNIKIINNQLLIGLLRELIQAATAKHFIKRAQWSRAGKWKGPIPITRINSTFRLMAAFTMTFPENYHQKTPTSQEIMNILKVSQTHS